jgi:hypothetical protein
LTKPVQELKQDKNNALYLFQLGYGLVALPLNLLNFASVIYYLVVANMPQIKAIFPEFWMFLLLGIAVGPLSCVLLGIAYVKSPVFKANYDINASANPYSFIILPKDKPMYMAIMKLCEKEGLMDEAKVLREIVENS